VPSRKDSISFDKGWKPCHANLRRSFALEWLDEEVSTGGGSGVVECPEVDTKGTLNGVNGDVACACESLLAEIQRHPKRYWTRWIEMQQLLRRWLEQIGKQQYPK
jgi:hypothetical protein